MTKIRLGIVGTGFGRYGLLPAFRRDPRCDVVSVAGSSPERVRHLAGDLNLPELYGDWREMLAQSNLDAVAVATPPEFQATILDNVIRQGKAVFAEKPLSLGLREAVRLNDAASVSGLPNMVDFIFPELGTWQKLQRLLTQGAIGTLRHVSLDWRMESYDAQHRITGWKTDSGRGGGVLQHFGSHSLHYLELLFGQIETITAEIQSAPGLQQRGDSFVSLSLRFAEGFSASVSLFNAATLNNTHQLEIYGSDGCLRLSNVSRDHVRGFELSMATRAASKYETIAIESDFNDSNGEDSRVEPVAHVATRFIDWCLYGLHAKPSFQEGLRTVQLTEICHRSDSLGRRLNVSDWIDRLVDEVR